VSSFDYVSDVCSLLEVAAEGVVEPDGPRFVFELMEAELQLGQRCFAA
jgi:hypothetical protein